MLYKEKKVNHINAFKATDSPPDFISSTYVVPSQGYENYACSKCNHLMKEHKYINDGKQQLTVCPNSYIIYEKGNIINIIPDQIFESMYTKVDCEDADFKEIINEA